RVKYYVTNSGRSPVEDFISNLPLKVQAEFVDAVAALESGAKLEMPIGRNLSSIYPGLHELRFRDKSGQFRLFYMIKPGDAIYLIHGLFKKTQTLPKQDRNIILKRIK